MHKHLTNLTTSQTKTNGPIRSWYSVLKNWSEARKLRKQESERAEFVSHLTQHIRYDLGETDCIRRRTTSDIWDNNSTGFR
jgi:hypothetical protein